MEPERSIHTYVTRLREARGWSMSELSRYAGVPQATVSRLEGGHTRMPTLATVRKLAAALGIPEQDLLGRTGQPAPPGQPPLASLETLAQVRAFLQDGAARGEWDARFAEALYDMLLAHAEALASGRHGEDLDGAAL